MFKKSLLLTSLEMAIFLLWFSPPANSYAIYFKLGLWFQHLGINLWALDYGNTSILIACLVSLFLFGLNTLGFKISLTDSSPNAQPQPSDSIH
jgi:hypothetical protein